MGLERLQAGGEGGAAPLRGVVHTLVSKKWLSATFSSFLIFYRFYRPGSQRQTGISPVYHAILLFRFVAEALTRFILTDL